MKNKLSNVLWLFAPIDLFLEMDSVGSDLQFYANKFLKIIDSKQKKAIDNLYKEWYGDEE